MKLNCETILDFYSHKNQRILCQIKANPKSGILKNSCRCLSQEDWDVFDKKLKTLITTTDDWNNPECLNFVIKPHIQVNVQKSNLSLKHFFKCFDAIDDDGSTDDSGVNSVNIVLECIFDFNLDVPSIDSHQYKQFNEISTDSNYCNSLSYTPPKRKCDADGVDTVRTPKSYCLGHKEITYSPKLISEIDSVESLTPNAVIRSKSVPVDRASISFDSNNFSDDEHSRKDNSLNTKCNENNNKLEGQEHSVFNKKGSNLGDVFLGQLSANKEKRTTRTRNYNDCDIKVMKNTLPKSLPNIAESALKNELENINRKSSSKSYKRDKTPSHSKLREKKTKRIDTVKEACHQPEKTHEPSSSEDEIMKSRIRRIPSDDESECTSEFDKNSFVQKANEHDSYLNTSLSPTNESKTNLDKQVKANIRESKELRRSQRSPSKTKRYVDEQHGLVTIRKSKKHKYTKKNKNVFATDDEDNDCFENNLKDVEKDGKMKSSAFETPVSKKPPQYSLSSSSTKMKRKRDKISSECEQEKRDISKWLCKKKQILDKEGTKLLHVRTKSSSSRALPLKNVRKAKPQKSDEEMDSVASPSPSTSISLELPTKEELELIRNKTKLIQTENAKVRAELDKMRASPPKKVEILSLQNIPADDILSTFLTYKSDLDDIFENNRKKDYIKGHGGINHCFVIRLLQQNVQMKMLEKLTEAYSNSKTTTQATLFANALFPEWVIRVYMEKFKFTREEAIDQIKAQEEFQLHMEDQSDSTFMFD